MLVLSKTPKFTVVDILNQNNKNIDSKAAKGYDFKWLIDQNEPCHTSSHNTCRGDENERNIRHYPPRQCIYIDLNCQYTQRYLFYCHR